jgi:hypothetical protein
LALSFGTHRIRSTVESFDGGVKMEYYHKTRAEFFQPVGFDIQGLPELADQNNTVKSLSSGNNGKNI